MNKRAISPVIATVLLVVVVIALFILIFLWIRGFQKEVITKYGTPIDTQCTALRYDVRYSVPSVEVSNMGSTTIYRANLYVGGKLQGNVTNIQPASSSTLTLACTPGTKLKAIPYLLGTTSSGVQKEYACEKQAKTITC